ncbi:MAG: AmmeMemoRadiSam system protein B [Sulfurospirillaceae bacterium]|nr:AmmeMemoRadiSam system protein B [Sulfurospirillaceae bacterium]
MQVRQSVVSGAFYPNECDEIQHYIAHFNATMPKINVDITARALIVPHAGYIYSGYTANLAYNLTASKRSDIKRVIVIGPSHRVYLEGASIALYDAFQTPCKNITIDLDYSLALKEQYAFLNFIPQAHSEHSTETQMPFIAHYFPQASVVEIVYGKIAHEPLSLLINSLLDDAQNLVVISTDLSHFHTQEVANAKDKYCIEAINHLDIQNLEQCEACGITGVKAMVQSAQKLGLKPHFLDYRTSYERTKDASRVVGYASFILGA